MPLLSLLTLMMFSPAASAWAATLPTPPQGSQVK